MLGTDKVKTVIFVITRRALMGKTEDRSNLVHYLRTLGYTIHKIIYCVQTHPFTIRDFL